MWGQRTTMTSLITVTTSLAGTSSGTKLTLLQRNYELVRLITATPVTITDTWFFACHRYPTYQRSNLDWHTSLAFVSSRWSRKTVLVRSSDHPSTSKRGVGRGGRKSFQVWYSRKFWCSSKFEITNWIQHTKCWTTTQFKSANTKWAPFPIKLLLTKFKLPTIQYYKSCQV